MNISHPRVVALKELSAGHELSANTLVLPRHAHELVLQFLVHNYMLRPLCVGRRL